MQGEWIGRALMKGSAHLVVLSGQGDNAKGGPFAGKGGGSAVASVGQSETSASKVSTQRVANSRVPCSEMPYRPLGDVHLPT